MTSTPESWDDLGSLRLKVECISQKLGLNNSELQELRDKVAFIDLHEQLKEQKHDRYQIKVCSIIIAVLLGCVLALQVFMIYTGSASGLTGLSDETWKTHPHDFKASEARNLAVLQQKDPEPESAVPQKHTEGESTPDGLLSLADKMQNSSGGVFYVCFPASAIEQNLEKYAPAFKEVARGWKHIVYPFCWIDTRKNLNKIYDEHFCDDVSKITFVMEKSRNGMMQSSKHAFGPDNAIQSESLFENCEDLCKRFPELFTIESSVWFRRIFRADQDIQPAVIKEFIDDVYSGQVQAALPWKRDL